MVGLGAVSTVWPDIAITTDEQLSELNDQWAQDNPWT
jgi:hypothetical protein